MLLVQREAAELLAIIHRAHTEAREHAQGRVLIPVLDEPPSPVVPVLAGVPKAAMISGRVVRPFTKDCAFAVSMQPPSTAPSGSDRRRFAFAQPGQLWMSDVMHGPSVRIPDLRGPDSLVRRKTYLIAFLGATSDALDLLLPVAK